MQATRQTVCFFLFFYYFFFALIMWWTCCWCLTVFQLFLSFGYRDFRNEFYESNREKYHIVNIWMNFAVALYNVSNGIHNFAFQSYPPASRFSISMQIRWISKEQKKMCKYSTLISISARVTFSVFFFLSRKVKESRKIFQIRKSICQILTGWRERKKNHPE